MPAQQWFLTENDTTCKKTVTCYEQLRDASKGTSEHKEKMLLAYLINKYQETKWLLTDVDPVEIIKIRMEEFGYKPAGLAREYGDKGTISKVLNHNYRQPLSLKMIRLFNKSLRIPADLLTKEYKLS